MNTALDEIKPSATLALAAKARQMRSEGEDVLSFTAGEPDFNTPEHIIRAAQRALDEGHTKYTPVPGIPELREAIAKKFQDNSLPYGSARVMATAGGKQALYNSLLVLCNPGDEVLIPSPYWLTYPEQARICRAVPRFIETEDGILTAESVRKGITEKSKVLIINSPSNPTGTVIPRDEMERIAETVKEHDLYVLSDEVYEPFLYSGEHVSIAALDGMFDHVITIGACSKAYSMTGWRLGWAAGPEKIVKKMIAVQSHTTSGPNSAAQHAALAALTGPQDSVEEMRKAFERRRKIMLDGLEAAGLTYMDPQGAFYVFTDISSTGMKGVDFAERLLEEKLVAVIPGEPFGSDRHVRLSYACSEEDIKKGMQRIKRFIG